MQGTNASHELLPIPALADIERADFGPHLALLHLFAELREFGGRLAAGRLLRACHKLPFPLEFERCTMENEIAHRARRQRPKLPIACICVLTLIIDESRRLSRSQSQ